MTPTETSEPRDRRDNAGPLLLQAAKKLFTEKGYQEVSTRELADLAGVNLAAIQYHFGSKARLFSDTVRSIMEESGCAQMSAVVNRTPANPSEAAELLYDFIRGNLTEMLRPRGPQACRIMFREMLSGSMENGELRSTLVETVVEHVTRPIDEMIVGLLFVIVPDASRSELERAVQSIIGQCSFYVSHQPFIEHLRGVKCAESPYFDQTIDHVFSFSLRALGCNSELIEKTLTKKTLDSAALQQHKAAELNEQQREGI